MHVDPAIAALRSDPASQRSCQEAANQIAEAWRASKPVTALARSLAEYADGADLDSCTALAALFADRACAAAFADHWCARMFGALRRNPLAEVPFRHRQSGGYSTVRLLTAGSAGLNLSAYERVAAPVEPQTVVFADRDCVELIVHGSLRGTSHRMRADAPHARIDTDWRSWHAGDRIATSAHHSRQFVAVEGAATVLQLTRAPDSPGPTREYRLTDGALIKSASGNKAASRDMLALGVLGALDFQPAAETMQAVALDSGREPDLRWEAARQLLALDTARGIALLQKLALCPDAVLADQAQRLMQQLAAAHSQLRHLIPEAA